MIADELDRAVAHMVRQAGALAAAQEAVSASDYRTLAEDLRAAATAAMASAGCLTAAALTADAEYEARRVA